VSLGGLGHKVTITHFLIFNCQTQNKLKLNLRPDIKFFQVIFLFEFSPKNIVLLRKKIFKKHLFLTLTNKDYMILFWPKASVFKKEQFSQKMALSLYFFIYLYISRGNDIYFVKDILCAYRLLRIKV
jgi:hypothetical protein